MEPEGGSQDGLLEQVVGLATDGSGSTLDRIAETVGRGLGARGCRLEAWVDGRRDGYDWPADAPPRSTVTRIPIRYGGRQIGQLAVELRPVDRLSGRHRRLMRDLGSVLGPVLHAAATRSRIAAEQAGAEEAAAQLAKIRATAVTEMEDDRRTLERDLHDGAQHHLVTLRLTAGLLDHALASGDVGAARDRLRELDGLLDLTETGLAATAAGVLPPDLIGSGLVAAFETELGSVPEMELDADGTVRTRRYPVPVEVTVFFACLEAVNNARKHARGAAVRIELRHTYRGLAFSVTDEGPGFDPDTLDPGSGLPRLADRLSAAGGELTVSSTPGRGTTVGGFIPV